MPRHFLGQRDSQSVVTDGDARRKRRIDRRVIGAARAMREPSLFWLQDGTDLERLFDIEMRDVWRWAKCVEH